MEEGALVTSVDLVELVKGAMAKSDGPFMLDGFPRNHDNVKAWSDMMEENTNTVGMLVLRLTPEVCKERLLGRNEGRADDNEATILKRLAVFENETVPVINDMKGKGNVMEVDASGSKEDVFKASCDHLDALMNSRKNEEKKEGAMPMEVKNSIPEEVNVPVEPHANAMYEAEEQKKEELLEKKEELEEQKEEQIAEAKEEANEVKEEANEMEEKKENAEEALAEE